MHTLPYSVVICSYNKLESLMIVLDRIRENERCLEIILVDDKSTDETMDWARDSNFFKHIYQRGQSGQYRLNGNRNIGISLAKHEHIVLLDADCAPEKKYFEGHDRVFWHHPGVISVGMTDRYNSNGKFLQQKDPRRKDFKDGKPLVGINWSKAYGGNVCFTKALWNKIGGFDEGFDGAWGFEDLDFSKRAANIKILCKSHKFSTTRHLHHKVSELAKKGGSNGRNSNLFHKKHGIKF